MRSHRDTVFYPCSTGSGMGETSSMGARCISTEIENALRASLPETYRILANSSLSVHRMVRKVVLSGSRGPKGGFRNDSDVDLSLVVNANRRADPAHLGDLLEEIIEATVQSWKGPVELDCAAVFDKSACGLACFDVFSYGDLRCSFQAPDCIGLYKRNKGFDGFVPPLGLEIRNVFPMITVWDRGRSSSS
jgi:predicted nucleotidyltransferase